MSSDKAPGKGISLRFPYLYLGSRRFHLLLVALILLCLYWYADAGITSWHCTSLAQKGKFTKAIVVRDWRMNNKGKTYFAFQYVVKGVRYETILSNEIYHTGDSVLFLYLEDSPGVSNTYAFIRDRYDSRLTPPKGK